MQQRPVEKKALPLTGVFGGKWNMPPVRNSRKPRPRDSSVETRTLVIGAVILVLLYLGQSYGAAYLEYYHVRGAVQEVAQRCVMTYGDDGSQRGRCELQIRNAVAEILGHDVPDLRADIASRRGGAIEASCDYTREVKPLGLSARTLHFHTSSTGEPAESGFNSNPP